MLLFSRHPAVNLFFRLSVYHSSKKSYRIITMSRQAAREARAAVNADLGRKLKIKTGICQRLDTRYLTFNTCYVCF